MNASIIKLISAVFLLAVLTACSTEEENIPPSTPDGDWGGSIDQNFFDDAATRDMTGITLDITNKVISDIRVNGVPSTLSKTGNIVADGTIYSSILNDGTAIVISFDASFTHATLMTDDGWFAVIQKGVSEPPTGVGEQLFTDRDDIIGNYNGSILTTDFANYSLLDGTAECADSTTCDVTSSGVTETISLIGQGKTRSTAFGEWIGNPGSATDNIAIIMSQDKNYIAGWNCISGSNSIFSCSFSAMSRI